MLGLGTSVTSIDSGQIYKELSELSNYSDLHIHFDMSTLAGDHGDAVTAVVNTGSGGVGYRINSAEGAPTLDRISLSKACVDFPNDGDDDNILDMAASYTTTGKAMTFFIVFQWDAMDNQVIVADSDVTYEDYITLGVSALRIALDGGTASAVTFNNTDNSTISYSHEASTPTVLLIQRTSSGVCNFFHDNNLKTGFLADTGAATFKLGAIGGTTSSSIVDFNGKICEVGLYNADIGDSNIPIILESLCTKWGVDRRE